MGGETRSSHGAILGRYVTVSCRNVRPCLDAAACRLAADIPPPFCRASASGRCRRPRTRTPHSLSNVLRPGMASGRAHGPALDSTRLIIPPAASLAADGLSALHSLGPQRRSAS